MIKSKEPIFRRVDPMTSKKFRNLKEHIKHLKQTHEYYVP